MEIQTRYSRAPIREAVIEIKVALPLTINLADLAKVQLGHEQAYPVHGTMAEHGFKYNKREGLSIPEAPKLAGHLFRSQDGKQIIQCYLERFAFGRLEPYEGWEPFCHEARRMWDVYRSIAHPERISRIAVRYINRIDIPLPISDFKDFLRTGPEVSPSLPQGLSGFFMHLEMPIGELQGMLLLNQTIVPPPDPSVVSVILDIDLFRMEKLPQSDPELWGLFEQFHVYKNKVFEDCITDQTRGLIK